MSKLRFDDKVGFYPCDWNLTRVNLLGDLYGGSTPDTTKAENWGGEIVWLVPSDLTALGAGEIYIYDSETKLTETGFRSCSTYMLPEQTLCLSSRATLGEAAISGVKLCTNQGFINVVADKSLCDVVYLLYWVKFQKNYISRFAAGTTFLEIGKRTFGKLKIAIPRDVAEQKAIAGILAKVDEAIEAVENSIKAAERLKRSLMQNLLSGKLKPDGTWRKPDEFYTDEKFGRVPKDWSLLPIGHSSICEINPSYSFEKEKEYDFLPMEAIRESFGGIEAFEKKVIVSGGYTRFQNGDILFAKITPCAENGKVALVEGLTTEIGFASTEFIVLKPKPRMHKKFFFYLLTTEFVHRLAISLMEGTTGRQRIPWKVFKNRIFCPFPDCEHEQKAIAERIHCFDDLQRNKKRELLSLSNLKKALMQNLLTGKVRVDVEKINKLLEDQ